MDRPEAHNRKRNLVKRQHGRAGYNLPANRYTQVGGTSGDAAWREQRGELATNEATKQKALECSERGLDGGGQVDGAWTHRK
mmetsp:Transcript_4706/g.5574  ORF Transcript_4706/g.5574 Transcript_4706/m.5574 type:complete len:82 (-) Transcript_4706:81-326(-)